jgi:hypothetical protein
LAVSLRESAQGVLGNIPKGTKQTLVKVLEDRFEPSSQTELYRAQMRKLRQELEDNLFLSWDKPFVDLPI